VKKNLIIIFAFLLSFVFVKAQLQDRLLLSGKNTTGLNEATLSVRLLPGFSGKPTFIGRINKILFIGAKVYLAQAYCGKNFFGVGLPPQAFELQDVAVSDIIIAVKPLEIAALGSFDLNKDSVYEFTPNFGSTKVSYVFDSLDPSKVYKQTPDKPYFVGAKQVSGSIFDFKCP
jgi:hypothetical protein